MFDRDAKEGIQLGAELLRLAGEVPPEVLESLSAPQREELGELQAILGRPSLKDTLRSLSREFLLYEGRVPAAEELLEFQRELDSSGKPVIRAERIVVLHKASKIEIDREALGLSFEGLIQHYQSLGVDPDPITLADSEHCQSLKSLAAELPDALFLSPYTEDRERLKQEVDSADLVVVVGGDDTFKLCSSLLGEKLVLGVNSAPSHSEGASLLATSANFPGLKDRLEAADFQIQEWKRLEVELNGNVLGAACSEVVLYAESARYSSRGVAQLLAKDGKVLEQRKLRGSGFVLASGLGSSGWFSSVARSSALPAYRWARGSLHFELIERELFNKEAEVPLVAREGQTIVFRNSANQAQELSLDSVSQFELKRGDEIRVRLSASPLRMVVP